jgi:hypothetical protein
VGGCVVVVVGGVVVGVVEGGMGRGGNGMVTGDCMRNEMYD